MGKSTIVSKGDIVFIEDTWGECVIKVKITETYPDDTVMTEGVCTVDKHNQPIQTQHGHFKVPREKIYLTAEDAHSAQDARNNQFVQMYCDKIKDLNDLISFPLHHCFDGAEFTDDNAVKAYKICAKKLLNIDLDVDSDIELE